MKRISFTILSLLLCICLNGFIITHAKEISTTKYLTEGYTSEGIHYTIYDVQPSVASTTICLQRAATQLQVTRQIHFDGDIIPPKTWYFAERINGYIYAGTLSLNSIQIIYGKTIATYKGYLTLVN